MSLPPVLTLLEVDHGNHSSYRGGGVKIIKVTDEFRALRFAFVTDIDSQCYWDEGRGGDKQSMLPLA